MLGSTLSIITYLLCLLCGWQVPDIYDAAKYDAIHNAHLGLDLRDLYQVHEHLFGVICICHVLLISTQRAQRSIPSTLCTWAWA